MSFGLKPRIFPILEEYNIIYEEEKEVSEMYFITKGSVGIGFNRYLQDAKAYPYEIVFTKGVNEQIGGYYVLENLPAEFVVVAVGENMEAFALQKSFLMGKILAEFPNKLRLI